MPARTPKAAVAAFEDRSRQIVGCITEHPLLVTAFRPSPRPLFVSFVPVGKPVTLRLRDGARDIAIAVRLDFQVDAGHGVEEGYEIRPIGYAYRLLDRDDREILAYHWHPFSVSPIAHPHLHLTSRIQSFELPSRRRIALADMHIATGFVTLADIVRLAISEFQVEPRRSNWAEILDADMHRLPGAG